MNIIDKTVEAWHSILDNYMIPIVVSWIMVVFFFLWTRIVYIYRRYFSNDPEGWW